jgi:hypothetical protein
MGRGTEKIAVTANADDIRIFLSTVTGIPKIHEVLLTFEQGSGAKINKLKSQALALGSWDRTVKIFDIPYADHLSILWLRIATTFRQSQLSWNRIVAQIKSNTQDDYARTMTFDERIRYVHEQLYSKCGILHKYSVPGRLYTTAKHYQRSICTEGRNIYGPVVNFAPSKLEGGWNLIHVKAKCRTLLFNSTQHLLANNKSTLHTCLADWQINGTRDNLPNIAHLPNEVDYIRQYILDIAYVGQKAESESRTAYRKRLYHTILYHVQTPVMLSQYASTNYGQTKTGTTYGVICMQHQHRTIKNQYGTEKYMTLSEQTSDCTKYICGRRTSVKTATHQTLYIIESHSV